MRGTQHAASASSSFLTLPLHPLLLLPRLSLSLGPGSCRSHSFRWRRPFNLQLSSAMATFVWFSPLSLQDLLLRSSSLGLFSFGSKVCFLSISPRSHLYAHRLPDPLLDVFRLSDLLGNLYLPVESPSHLCPLCLVLSVSTLGSVSPVQGSFWIKCLGPWSNFPFGRLSLFLFREKRGEMHIRSPHP